MQSEGHYQVNVPRKHFGDKVIAFNRAGLLFVINFHPTENQNNYKVGVHKAGK
jgi:1,4-alpha-glucan branching enzyme